MPTQESQNQQLADYIKKNLAKGYTQDSLRFALLKQGYSRTTVEKALEIANKQMAAQAPKMVEKPVITYSFDDSEVKQKMAEQDGKGFFKRLFGWFGN